MFLGRTKKRSAPPVEPSSVPQPPEPEPDQTASRHHHRRKRPSSSSPPRPSTSTALLPANNTTDLRSSGHTSPPRGTFLADFDLWEGSHIVQAGDEEIPQAFAAHPVSETFEPPATVVDQTTVTTPPEQEHQEELGTASSEDIGGEEFYNSTLELTLPRNNNALDAVAVPGSDMVRINVGGVYMCTSLTTLTKVRYVNYCFHLLVWFSHQTLSVFI